VSTLTPTKPADKKEKRAAPPDEQFWVRYSPHYEMPLSWVGSGAVHAIMLGLLILAGFAIALVKDTKPPEVDSVRLGGGGGDLDGVGDVPGKGNGDQINEIQQKEPNKFDGKVESGDLPKIRERLHTLPDPPDGDAQIEKFREMARVNAEKIKEGLSPARGKGGDGAGGGNGRGEGPGDGDGKGPGDGGKHDKRVDRMLRWTMQFDIHSGADYAKQLGSLGVFIAVDIPDEPGKVRVYETIEPNAKSEVKELKNIYRMPWIDSRRQSVSVLCDYMGIRPTPPRIIAYMTEKMEANLLKMELKAARGVEEDKIDETVFKIVPRAGRYEPVVEAQRLK
jgi:hypothetical protein